MFLISKKPQLIQILTNSQRSNNGKAKRILLGEELPLCVKAEWFALAASKLETPKAKTDWMNYFLNNYSRSQSIGVLIMLPALPAYKQSEVINDLIKKGDDGELEFIAYNLHLVSSMRSELDILKKYVETNGLTEPSVINSFFPKEKSPVKRWLKAFVIDTCLLKVIKEQKEDRERKYKLVPSDVLYPLRNAAKISKDYQKARTVTQLKSRLHYATTLANLISNDVYRREALQCIEDTWKKELEDPKVLRIYQHRIAPKNRLVTPNLWQQKIIDMVYKGAAPFNPKDN